MLGDVFIVKLVIGFNVPTTLILLRDSQLPSETVAQYSVVAVMLGLNTPVLFDATRLPPVSASYRLKVVVEALPVT